MKTLEHRHAGHVIQARLDSLGRTQTWLSHQVKVSPQAVTKWCRTGQIAARNAAKVADALGLEVGQILAPDGERSNIPALIKENISQDERESTQELIPAFLTLRQLKLIQRYAALEAQAQAFIDLMIQKSPLEPAFESAERVPEDPERH